MSTELAANGTSGRILDIAERLVQTRGFNAFSYADIAAALNITKASLHYHFATKAKLGERLVERYQESFIAALARIDGQILVSYPNADAGSHQLIARARAFAATHANTHVFVNLGAIPYWSLLRQVEMLIGNSSSGIMETASFALPTVDIGLRQRGRERARNVLNAAPDAAAILEKIADARSAAFRDSLAGLENPYGDGHASEKIVEALTTIPLTPELLIKRAQ